MSFKIFILGLCVLVTIVQVKSKITDGIESNELNGTPNQFRNMEALTRKKRSSFISDLLTELTDVIETGGSETDGGRKKRQFMGQPSSKETATENSDANRRFNPFEAIGNLAKAPADMALKKAMEMVYDSYKKSDKPFGPTYDTTYGTPPPSGRRMGSNSDNLESFIEESHISPDNDYLQQQQQLLQQQQQQQQQQPQHQQQQQPYQQPYQQPNQQPNQQAIPSYRSLMPPKYSGQYSSPMYPPTGAHNYMGQPVPQQMSHPHNGGYPSAPRNEEPYFLNRRGNALPNGMPIIPNELSPNEVLHYEKVTGRRMNPGVDTTQPFEPKQPNKDTYAKMAHDLRDLLKKSKKLNANAEDAEIGLRNGFLGDVFDKQPYEKLDSEAYSNVQAHFEPKEEEPEVMIENRRLAGNSAEVADSDGMSITDIISSTWKGLLIIYSQISALVNDGTASKIGEYILNLFKTLQSASASM